MPATWPAIPVHEGAATTARRTVASHRAVASQATVLTRRAPGLVGACGVIALGMIATVGSPAKMLDGASAWAAAQAATGYSAAGGSARTEVATTLTATKGAAGEVSHIAGLAATGTYR